VLDFDNMAVELYVIRLVCEGGLIILFLTQLDNLPSILKQGIGKTRHDQACDQGYAVT